ncbi:hypothetical protein [Defluviimonas sp. WL0075]|uniref:Uncharacterized protein n=1 Tax=Albidovulum sediminicola TaxID=2984331 RepID=A0ABT2Z713_9RHOB|nr:hypothetical protein [Defluviimonas sp. WL0075]MCV2866918.1 hypothetical protein [Defluviimonas sp. WL0075]
MTDEKKPTEAQLPALKGREAPSMKLQPEGKALQVTVKGDYSRIRDGAGNTHVADVLLHHLACLGSQGKRFDDDASNFALGFVDSMQPRDAAETLLLAQMAATHQAVMMFARRLNHVEHLAQQDSAERAYNKLVRSYAAQMETLKRYRSKGQQVVRVERVTVESGGQAVVGNVQHGGRGSDES